MKTYTVILPRWLFLGLLIGVTGCSSFLQEQGMKNYRVQPKAVANIPRPTPYQEDFIYLKTLGEEVVPLEDKYFPPDKRAALEQEIMADFAKPSCSKETFVYDICRYLAGFCNEHARKENDSWSVRLDSMYPVRFHHVGSELFVLNVSCEYDQALVGQKVISINGRPVAEVEAKLSAWLCADNLWVRRNILEQWPYHYSRPDLYRLAGLYDASSPALQLEFADHAPITIMSVSKDVPWHMKDPKPHPVTAYAKHLYDGLVFPDQNYAYLQFNVCYDKSAILDGLSTYVKPWVQPLARVYLGYQFHRKKPSGQLANMYDPARPLFKDYLATVISDANRQGVTNLIIDLRNNGGGEFELAKQLIYYLTRREDLKNFKVFCYNPEVFSFYSPAESRESRLWYVKKFGAEPPMKQLSPTRQQDRTFFVRITDPKSPYYVAPDRPVFNGRVIVLANQNTGSAAALLTGILQDNQLAVVVGTTTGNNPTGPTVKTTFKLPRSGLRLSLPTEYFERAVPAKGDVFQPDFWVENTVDDLLAGRDAAFEKALELVRAP